RGTLKPNSDATVLATKTATRCPRRTGPVCVVARVQPNASSCVRTQGYAGERMRRQATCNQRHGDAPTGDKACRLCPWLGSLLRSGRRFALLAVGGLPALNYEKAAQLVAVPNPNQGDKMAVKPFVKSFHVLLLLLVAITAMATPAFAARMEEVKDRFNQ